MNREKSLLKNTAVIGIGTFLPKAASIILLPLLTGFLTKEEYGTYDLVTILVSLILPSLTLQIQQAAFRFLIDARGDAEKTSSVISNILLFVIPVATVGTIVLFVVMPIHDPSILTIVCAYYWIDVIEVCLLQCVRGIGDNLSYSISAVVCSLSQLLFALLFVCGLGLGFKGAVLMLLAADIAELIYILIKTPVLKYFDLAQFDPSLTMAMLSYSWPLVPNSMSLWVMRMSNRLVITFYLGLAANATFAVAYKIPQMITLAQNTFTMAWQENATIAAEDDDNDAYYSKMFKVVFDIIAGLMGLLMAFTPVLFRILIKGDYEEAFPQIPIMFLGMFFFSIASFLGGIYVAKMKTASIGITTVAAAIINLIIDVIGIPIYGLYAASVAILVSFSFLCIYRMIEVKKFTRIEYDIKRCSSIAAIILVMAIICYSRNVLGYLVNVIIGIVLFIVLDRFYLSSLVHMVKSKFIKR